MAFPAPPGVDEDAAVGSVGGFSLDDAVDDPIDGAPETVPIAVLDTESGNRGRVGDSPVEDVLDDAAIADLLELALLGVLPEPAGLSGRDAAHAARVADTLRG